MDYIDRARRKYDIKYYTAYGIYWALSGKKVLFLWMSYNVAWRVIATVRRTFGSDKVKCGLKNLAMLIMIKRLNFVHAIYLTMEMHAIDILYKFGNVVEAQFEDGLYKVIEVF